VSLSLWVLLAPLALTAVHLCRELHLHDVILVTVVVLVAVQTAIILTRFDAGAARSVDGAPCNGDAGRKLFTRGLAPGNKAPAYWACVPVAEYAARRAAQPAPRAAGPGRAPSFWSVFRLVLRGKVASRSLIFGTLLAVSGWLYAFGWRWRVRTAQL